MTLRMIAIRKTTAKGIGLVGCRRWFCEVENVNGRGLDGRVFISSGLVEGAFYLSWVTAENSGVILAAWAKEPTLASSIAPVGKAAGWK